MHTYTHSHSLFLPPSTHSAAVCEIKSIPPATPLPSKSDPAITTTTATCTYTHNSGSVKDLSLSSLSLSPCLHPSIILFLFIFIAETLSITPLPQHTPVDLLSDKRSAFEHVGVGKNDERELKGIFWSASWLQLPGKGGVYYESISPEAPL